MSKNLKVQESQIPNPKERRFSLEQLSQRWGKLVSDLQDSLRRGEFQRVVYISTNSRNWNPNITHYDFEPTIWPHGDCNHLDRRYGPRDLLPETDILLTGDIVSKGFFPSEITNVWIPEDAIRQFEQINNLIPKQQEALAAAKA